MLKWIKNSKGASTNKSSDYKGIYVTRYGKYRTKVVVRNGENPPYTVNLGNFNTLKEAKKARVDYILSLL